MDENNEYFKCFRVLFHVMKIFGIFPFLFSHKGTSKHLFISRLLVFFSTVFFIPLCAQQYIYVVKNINLILVNFRFEIFVKVIPPIATRLVILMIPVLTWPNSKKIYIHLNKWKNLQDTLANIQKAQYKSPLVYWVPPLNVFFIIFSLGILLPFQSHFDLNTSVSTSLSSFLYLAVIFFSIEIYWFSNCLFVILVAKHASILIKNSIINNCEDNLNRLVRFWVDLYDWNTEFSSTVSVTFLMLISSMIVTLVACFYTFAFLIVVEEDKIAGLAYIVFTGACLLVLLVFSESANFLTTQIGTQIEETILNSNTTKMNLRLMAVMLIFLQTIEARKPKIMLNGVMILNRSSILAIFATSINFLIVLKQFNT